MSERAPAMVHNPTLINSSLANPSLANPATATVATVIGGGFYGCSMAHFLAQQGLKVHLVEAKDMLLARASYRNQARLHGGYHYPRSFSTAYRSRHHFTRFYKDFKPAIVENFAKFYAIARYGKVSAVQFARFCEQIQAPLAPAAPAIAKLFTKRLIEQVFKVEEYAFDAGILRRMWTEMLAKANVTVHLETNVTALVSSSQLSNASHHTKPLYAILKHATLEHANTTHTLPTDWVINCTYSGLNSISGLFTSRQRLKHELAELALFEPPEALQGLSVTVMDGPFFSFMPFPDRNLTTLTHVRYTPHTAIAEDHQGRLSSNTNTFETNSTPNDLVAERHEKNKKHEGHNIALNPYTYFASLQPQTTYPYMIRDAARYLPALAGSQYVTSLFEIKTVLQKNEKDDGRPILFEYDTQHPTVVSMLGSKLDNIYDAHTALHAHMQHPPVPDVSVASGFAELSV